ncbi:MAG: AMP-binding protein [Desulfuromonadaceae bacterium]|nr:AMP-binding protein [Desulfuromonadaceae bacterium]MDD5107782.1 AMP-binding protein [Desulfuromonadaceae bacterium]
MHIDLNSMTFPKLLKAQAARFGTKKTALRKKGLGIWQNCSWQQYFDNVRTLALGLHSLGFGTDDKLAIIGNNRPESLFAEIAAQAAGGVAVSLYHDSTPQEIAKALQQFDVTVAFVEDQEQADKLLDQLGCLPKLRRIIYVNSRGMRKYSNKLLASYDSIRELGTTCANQKPELFDNLIGAGKGDDTAIICLTSGATGVPKGAMLSFKNLISMSLAFDEADRKRTEDEFVSLLPLAWFGEQLMSVAAPLVVGYTINFPEKEETAMADLREIGPHIMLSPPKLWESIAASVRVRMMDSTPFKKFMFNTFMPIGERYADCVLAGTAPSFSLQIFRFIADLLLFRALRDRLGLSHVRSALTGGASLGSTVFRFFHAIGVNLKQLYGQTEISGITCMHRDGAVNGTTVGLPLAGTEIRVDEHGELLSKSAGLFKGYYGDEEATRQAFTSDGWLKSGDAGHIDANGHITITDRIGALLTLADGSRYSAQHIENNLRFSPYISEAIVFGGNTSPLVALIGITSHVVGKWAGDNKLSYMTFADLTSRPEVIDLIAGEVAKTNATLPSLASITRFAIIYKELDADEGELTRTGKLRREAVAAIYKELIDALHSGIGTVQINTSVDFSDGKSGHIQTTVCIRTI